MCTACHGWPAKVLHCPGNRHDPDWKGYGPGVHSFPFCADCAALIETGDRPGLEARIDPGFERHARIFIASTGLLGPRSPYVAYLVPLARRVYVHATETHLEFNVRLPDWPNGPLPETVSNEDARCIVAFPDGSTLEYHLDAEYVTWLEKHPSGAPLGQRVSDQRKDYWRRKLDHDRIERLDSVHGWSWGRSRNQSGTPSTHNSPVGRWVGRLRGGEGLSAPRLDPTLLPIPAPPCRLALSWLSC